MADIKVVSVASEHMREQSKYRQRIVCTNLWAAETICKHKWKESKYFQFDIDYWLFHLFHGHYLFLFSLRDGSRSCGLEWSAVNQTENKNNSNTNTSKTTTGIEFKVQT